MQNLGSRLLCQRQFTQGVSSLSIASVLQVRGFSCVLLPDVRLGASGSFSIYQLFPRGHVLQCIIIFLKHKGKLSLLQVPIRYVVNKYVFTQKLVHKFS